MSAGKHRGKNRISKFFSLCFTAMLYGEVLQGDWGPRAQSEERVSKVIKALGYYSGTPLVISPAGLDTEITFSNDRSSKII